MLKVSSFVAFSYVLSIAIRCHGLELDLPGRIIAAALTPYDKNQDINYEIIPTLAQLYADHNITNILISEWFGEAPSIPLRERQDYVAAWMKAATPLKLNIIVEVGLLPYRDVLTLVKYCRELNVKAITVFPEQIYQAQTIDQMIKDLKAISDAAPDLPLIYNELISTDPKVSTADVFLAASERVPSFVGVVTNLNTAMDIKASSSLAGKVIWIYDNQYLTPTLTLRLNGTVTTAPNLFPELVLALEAAINRCDIDQVSVLQEKLNQLIAAICNLDGGVIDTYARSYLENLKVAFRLLTGMDLGVRVPFQEVNSTVKSQIATNLKQFGVKLYGSDN